MAKKELEEQDSKEEVQNIPEVTPNGQDEKEEELILGKFKTREDLENSYKELEKKQGGFADVERERDEYRRYATQVQPVIDQIERDEDLANIVREKMGLKPVEKTDEKNQPQDEAQVEVQEVKDRLSRIEGKDRVDTVRNFEKKYGIDALEKDAQKDMRRRIEGRLNKWGKSARGGNSTELAGLLEDAYALENNNEQIEQARNEAIIKTRQNELGITGNGNAMQVASPTTVSLSPDERDTAQKMGTSEKDYLAMKIEIMKEKGLIK